LGVAAGDVAAAGDVVAAGDVAAAGDVVAAGDVAAAGVEPVSVGSPPVVAAGELVVPVGSPPPSPQAPSIVAKLNIRAKPKIFVFITPLSPIVAIKSFAC
jgi:hypothetical protein